MAPSDKTEKAEKGAAKQTKTNFKSYDAAIRLLAAVLATTKTKLDYKALAEHVGGGTEKVLSTILQLAKLQSLCVAHNKDPGDLPTETAEIARVFGGGYTPNAMEIRFRQFKKLADAQVACLAAGRDPIELPMDLKEIQKLFGESTTAGIEWQFREIKALGKAQEAAVKKGEDPSLLDIGARATPARSRGKGAAKAKASTPGTPTSTLKRKAAMPDEHDDREEDDEDFDVKDEYDTPSRPPARKRAATTKQRGATVNVRSSDTTSASLSGNGRASDEFPSISTDPSADTHGGNGELANAPFASSRATPAKRPGSRKSIAKAIQIQDHETALARAAEDLLGDGAGLLDDGEV